MSPTSKACYSFRVCEYRNELHAPVRFMSRRVISHKRIRLRWMFYLLPLCCEDRVCAFCDGGMQYFTFEMSIKLHCIPFVSFVPLSPLYNRKTGSTNTCVRLETFKHPFLSYRVCAAFPLVINLKSVSMTFACLRIRGNMAVTAKTPSRLTCTAPRS